MKKISKALYTFIITFSLLLCCSVSVFADDLDGSGDDTEDVPIDGGISLLVAAGVGYGAKKLHEAKKKKAVEDNNEQPLK